MGFIYKNALFHWLLLLLSLGAVTTAKRTGIPAPRELSVTVSRERTVPRGPSLEILLLLVPPSNQSFSRRLSTSCGREVTLLIPSTSSTLRCRLGRRTDSLRSFFLLHSSDTRFSHRARWTATTSFDLHAHPVSHLTVWLFFPNCGNGE